MVHLAIDYSCIANLQLMNFFPQNFSFFQQNIWGHLLGILVLILPTLLFVFEKIRLKSFWTQI
jgi:hypothetical protein